ncbi:Gamma-aminobutyric acid (GABA) B receptor [Seminavis robusta]|uniref:Gamma-aminobutyric acid (GABA) B receptor n=1 Tax=Seminavis robusta TaxID=568900 RepID=A0A9N8EPW4_9STRA|nr:Gamma-aminobutyric acid (GABA) B receptor [Seminavis robusta]|eukprot:Sro1476_g275940.1 Gamma-aminobutyric acid (GABA) B receptor (710) ;mRNA; f:19624-22083
MLYWFRCPLQGSPGLGQSQLHPQSFPPLQSLHCYRHLLTNNPMMKKSTCCLCHIFYWMLVHSGIIITTPLVGMVSAGAAFSVEDAYNSRPLSVFYNEEDESWSITPEDLKEIVLSNIHKVRNGAKIYGSAIAFEPNVWRQTFGLEAGVPFPAASDACMNHPSELCQSTSGDSSSNNSNSSISSSSHRLDTLASNPQGETLYCPYAYHGPPSQDSFANCSKATPEFCPTMDIAHSYDYSDTNNPAEWFTAPRCLFFKDGIRTGYWTAPYFDEGAGNINMVTFSQPITKGDNFLGIATIDIEVMALCYGNQCDNACPAEFYKYTVSDCIGPSGNRIITYTTEDPSCPINPDHQSILSCSYVPISSTVGIICYSLGSLGAVVCLAVLLLLFIHRDSALIRASQVNISCCFVLAAMMTNLSTFVYIGDYQGHKCSATLWAAGLPVTMFLSFLFGKVYRTYRVFMKAKQCQRYKLSDSKLLLKISAVIMVQIVILLVWTFVEDPHVATRTMVESIDSRYCDGDDCYPMEEYCTQKHYVVGIISLAYIILLVIVGCVLSYQSRTLPNCFSEAKHVMLAMYNFAVNATLLLLVELVGVLIIYAPKFVKIWETSESQMEVIVRDRLSVVMWKSERPSSRAKGRTLTLPAKREIERSGCTTGTADSLGRVCKSDPEQFETPPQSTAEVTDRGQEELLPVEGVASHGFAERDRAKPDSA